MTGSSRGGGAPVRSMHCATARRPPAWTELFSVLVVPGYATAAEDLLREQAARSGAEVRFAGWL